MTAFMHAVRQCQLRRLRVCKIIYCLLAWYLGVMRGEVTPTNNTVQLGVYTCIYPGVSVVSFPDPPDENWRGRVWHIGRGGSVESVGMRP